MRAQAGNPCRSIGSIDSIAAAMHADRRDSRCSNAAYALPCGRLSPFVYFCDAHWVFSCGVPQVLHCRAGMPRAMHCMGCQ